MQVLIYIVVICRRLPSGGSSGSRELRCRPRPRMPWPQCCAPIVTIIRRLYLRRQVRRQNTPDSMLRANCPDKSLRGAQTIFRTTRPPKMTRAIEPSPNSPSSNVAVLVHTRWLRSGRCASLPTKKLALAMAAALTVVRRPIMKAPKTISDRIPILRSPLRSQTGDPESLHLFLDEAAQNAFFKRPHTSGLLGQAIALI
jgi:hypothetical protein